MNTTTTPIPTDLAEFEKFLASHDWYYGFSDDHRVWQRGVDAQNRLDAFMKTATDDHKRLYNREHKRRYGGPEFVTPTRPYVYPYLEVEP